MKERLQILKDLWDDATKKERTVGIVIFAVIILFLAQKLFG